MGFIATALASVGTVLASMGSSACILLIADEPDCPQSLIK